MKHEDEDFEMNDEYDFTNGIRGRFYRPNKVSMTIRIDDDILIYLKKIASKKKIGYQTIINILLRDCIEHDLKKIDSLL